ncbi:MAG: M50 family metallopeptidase [Ignavibacteriae bacterium]|nr:M50 family metallopeptidase [Ignavibacteriota bacterium]
MVKNKSAFFSFGIILSLVIISLFLFDTFLLFPLKLFIIIFHEISHVLAGIISGGKINYLTFDLNLAGKTSIEGGNSIIIASAGYLGSLIFGSLLFLSSFSIRFKKWYLSILALVVFIVTVNLVKGELQIFLGLIASLILFLIPRYLPEKISKLFLQYFGLVSCLYIISDIKEDLLTQTIRETDTQILEYLTGISSNVWGFIWFIISIIVMLFLLKFTFKNSKN